MVNPKTMAAAPSAAQIAGPTASSARGVLDVAEILRKLTELFLSGTEHLGDHELGLYDDIFVRLIPQAGPQALAELSTRLSGATIAPPATTHFLALHGDALIAAPMLVKASWLPQRVLAEIIKTGSPPHLLAIASRRGLDEKLTDPLIARGYRAVRVALAQNLSARFSDDGYRTLFKSAERDAELAEKLAGRSDLPALLSREFVASALNTSRATFIRSAPPAAQPTLQKTPLSRTANRALEDYAEARKEVAALSRAGKLGDSSVNRFAVAHDYVAVIAALALLADVAIETIEPLMGDDRLFDLIMACKASRLCWATTLMIIRNRPGCDQPSAEELDEGRKRFERTLLSEAQWKIRFGLTPAN
jgi:uncharacterized protein (DUF2336 family)